MKFDEYDFNNEVIYYIVPRINLPVLRAVKNIGIGHLVIGHSST